MALKCIVTQTLSGPGEEMSKALSNLIQVGPALGRGGGFQSVNLQWSLPTWILLWLCGIGLGVGGVGGVHVWGGEGKS